MKFLFLLLLVASTAEAGDIYGWDTLKPALQGFGKTTTGGYNGVVYTVTDLRDYSSKLDSPIKGTLRYGIEESDFSKPLWIKFDSKFKDGRPHEINLVNTLSFYVDKKSKYRNNITIDGRGANITMKTTAYWSSYEWYLPDGDKRYACRVKSGISGRSLELARIQTVFGIAGNENVIITNMSFARENWVSGITDVGGVPVLDSDLNKECLGDYIQMVSKSSSHIATRVWINKVSMTHCGDGCIDITRTALEKPAFVTLSHSYFFDTDKTMIAGGTFNYDGDSGYHFKVGEYPLRLSMYNNYFKNAAQRMPKAYFALIHAFNNFYENWSQSTVSASATYGSKVFFENNYIRNTIVRPILASGSDQNVYSYKNNIGTNLAPLVDLSTYLTYRDHWLSTAGSSPLIKSAATLSPTSFATSGNKP
jgi:pectate lyase